jgi:hypothetical protein
MATEKLIQDITTRGNMTDNFRSGYIALVKKTPEHPFYNWDPNCSYSHH